MLIFKPSKIQFILFLVLRSKVQIRKKNEQNPMVEIGGDSIEQVCEVRNLGILMDNELRFEKYVADTVRNCFYKLKVLYRYACS